MEERAARRPRPSPLGPSIDIESLDLQRSARDTPWQREQVGHSYAGHTYPGNNYLGRGMTVISPV